MFSLWQIIIWHLVEAVIQSAEQWHESKHKLAMFQRKEMNIIWASQLGQLTETRDFNSNTLFSLVDDFKIHERHLKKRKTEENYYYYTFV